MQFPFGDLNSRGSFGRFGILCFVLLMAAADAEAQPPPSIGPVVFDVRGSLARFKGDTGTATGLGVTAADMPTKGLGISAGAHWYPLRLRRITLGVGGELLIARDSHTKEQTDATIAAPTVTTRFSSLTPQLSLNFGTGDGWSYVSGGIGVAGLTSEVDAAASAGGAGRVRATNYGGGARWFTGPHMAFSVDLRFYTINEQPAAGTSPAYSRSRFMAINVGVAVR